MCISAADNLHSKVFRLDSNRPASPPSIGSLPGGGGGGGGETKNIGKAWSFSTGQLLLQLRERGRSLELGRGAKLLLSLASLSGADRGPSRGAHRRSHHTAAEGLPVCNVSCARRALIAPSQLPSWLFLTILCRHPKTCGLCPCGPCLAVSAFHIVTCSTFLSRCVWAFSPFLLQRHLPLSTPPPPGRSPVLSQAPGTSSVQALRPEGRGQPFA